MAICKALMIFFVTVGLGLVLFNSVMMALWPARWLDLPRWIAGHGSFDKTYLSSKTGRVSIRMTGLFLVSGIALMIAIFFANHNIVPRFDARLPQIPAAWHTEYIVEAYLVIFGAIMIWRPIWYFDWFFAPRLPVNTSPGPIHKDDSRYRSDDCSSCGHPHH